MKKILHIIIGVLLVLQAGAQTPAATSEIMGPFGPYRGINNGLIIPYLKVLSADAKQTLAGTGFIGKKYPVIIGACGIGEETKSYPTMAGMGTADLPDLYATSLPKLVRYTNSPLYNKRYAAPGRTDSTSYCYLFPQPWQGYSYFYPSYAYWLWVNEIRPNHHIYDTTRVYIVGLSYGAGFMLMCWQDPNLQDKFAGGYGAAPGFNKTTNLPTDWLGAANAGWFVRLGHSTNDSTTPKNPSTKVGSYISDQVSDSIRKYGGISIFDYDRWITGGHSTWDRWQDPTNAATNYPQSNGQNVNYLIDLHSVFLQFSTKGRRKVVP
jgi:hypothetical protein